MLVYLPLLNPTELSIDLSLTVASENDLYWEFWRPMEAFLRPANMVDVHLDPSLFQYKNNTEDVVVQANPKILYFKGKDRKQPSASHFC